MQTPDNSISNELSEYNFLTVNINKIHTSINVSVIAIDDHIQTQQSFIAAKN